MILLIPVSCFFFVKNILSKKKSKSKTVQDRNIVTKDTKITPRPSLLTC